MTDSRRPLLLIGAGGHALACIDVIEQEGRYAIVGLVGQAAEVGRQVLGYPVVDTDDGLTSLAARIPSALVVVGQIKTPDARVRLYERALAAGFSLPAIVSPRAYVSPHARIGAGTVVMHDAVIGAGARVGANCILNTRSHLEHEVVVEDHVHVSTAAVINGRARVGERSFVGSGSLVIEGAQIAAGSVIPMGSRVGRDGMPRHLAVSATGGAA